MRTTAGLIAFLLALSFSTLSGQGIPLTVGQPHADSVGPEEVDTFTVELAADQFVMGAVDQQSVDAMVRILNPAGETIAQVDVAAQGPDVFQFTSKAAGRYRIEVRSFEGDDGLYSILLQRVEPVATDPEARVDQLMALYDNDHTPGGYIGVIRHGQLVFAKAYGMADLAFGVPYTTDTRNNIGSTSKQFTAFAINLLAERGKLSLDDDVRDYIPELPDFGKTVTLRHLLSHTSGYREFVNELALAGRRVDQGDFIGRFEVIELIQHQPELQNDPGAEFNYNNSGFSLLSTIVERVGEEPFPEWMHDNVFGPLGMDHTMIISGPDEIVPNGSQGYVPGEGSGWREARDLGASMGAGGIYTTVGDLAKWMDNFKDPTLGSPQIFKNMTNSYMLTSGKLTGYGQGLFIDEYRGLRRFQHGGADIAHRSMLLYFPSLDAGVVTESNNATFDAAGIANGVVDAFFDEDLEPEEEAGEEEGGAVAESEFDVASYDPESFDPFIGRYSLDEAPQFILEFTRAGDTIYAQGTGQPKFPVEPTSDSTFKFNVVEASITFHRNDDGAADSLTLHQNGEHVAHKLEAEKWEPSVEDLESYTGRWYSAELQTFYDVAVEDSALVIRQRRYAEPLKLSPGEEADHFTGGFPVATADFTRDENGEVIGLEVGNGRTRGVKFERVGGM